MHRTQPQELKKENIMLKQNTLIFVLVITALFRSIPVHAASSAEEIINNVEAVESIAHSTSKAKQIITTSSGRKREFEIRAFALDTNEKQLQIYDKPARVRGEKILMLNDGDDIWSYSPKTKRVRHLATHMKKAKVMGSDFSYQDFAAGDYRKRFAVKLIGEEKKQGTECYKLELIPTKDGPSYTKQIFWVGTDDYVLRQCDYYDDKGLLKSLIADEIKTIQKVPTIWKMTMKNVRDGGSTVIEMIEIDYTTKPDADMFTKEGLKK